MKQFTLKGKVGKMLPANEIAAALKPWRPPASNEARRTWNNVTIALADALASRNGWRTSDYNDFLMAAGHLSQGDTDDSRTFDC